MNSTQMQRKLQSIGKECFVTYFDQFADMRNTDASLVNTLMHDRNYTENGSRIRVSCARSIIRAGMTKAALNEVLMSNRLDHRTRRTAAEIFRSL